MGETINQIERELADERVDLNRNLHELQTRARELTDWRHHYRKHPLEILGVALAAGVVLGIVAGAKSGASSSEFRLTPDNGVEARAFKPKNRAMAKLEEDWRHISDALMGVASAKVIDFVGNLIPGFRDEINRKSHSIS